MIKHQETTHPFPTYQARRWPDLPDQSGRPDADKPINTADSLRREMRLLLSRHGEPMHRFDIFRAMKSIGFPGAEPHPLHNFNQHLKEDPNLVPTGNGHWTTQELFRLQQSSDPNS